MISGKIDILYFHHCQKTCVVSQDKIQFNFPFTTSCVLSPTFVLEYHEVVFHEVTRFKLCFKRSVEIVFQGMIFSNHLREALMILE